MWNILWFLEKVLCQIFQLRYWSFFNISEQKVFLVCLISSRKTCHFASYGVLGLGADRILRALVKL